MLTQFLYSLDILPLIAAICILWMQNLFGIQSTRSYFFSTRICLVLSIIFSAIFYDKSVWSQYLENTAFTTVFYILTALLALIWLALAERWFKNKNLSACRFCMLAIGALISLKIMIEAINLGVLSGGLSLLLLVNYLFLRLSEDNDELHNTSLRYGLSALFFIIWLGVVSYFTYPADWPYNETSAFLQTGSTLWIGIISGGIILSLFFLLGAAPLHFWVADVVAPAILPVATYFSYVPQLILWSVFIKLNLGIFAAQAHMLSPLYMAFGLISVFSAAMNAHISRNVRKIFAASGLYSIGIMLLAASSLSNSGYLASTVYLLLFLLPLTGIYTAFYGFTSGGDYLYNLNMVSGFAKNHPYVGSSLIIFITVLTGLAPLPVFIGLWLVCDDMAHQTQFLQIFTVLLGMILLIPAYLQVIQKICFGQKETNFDRVDPGVHLLLGVMLALIAVIIFQPQIIIANVQILLNVLTGVS